MNASAKKGLLTLRNLAERANNLAASLNKKYPNKVVHEAPNIFGIQIEGTDYWFSVSRRAVKTAVGDTEPFQCYGIGKTIDRLKTIFDALQALS